VRLNSLSLENVRSYDRLELGFRGSKRHVFVGSNGSGKTNLVEALSYLSWGRSCLRAAADDVLRWGEDFFRIRAEGTGDDGSVRSLEYVWQRAPRRQCATFINDVRTPLLKFVGALKTVIFLPEDLDLFTGAPQKRRNFLDVLISQNEERFVHLRIEYERLIKQRNALLKQVSEGQAGRDEIRLWDEQLSEVAAGIQLKRIALIERFTAGLPGSLGALGEEAGDAAMVYVRKTKSLDARELVRELKSLYGESCDRDLILQTTTVGPHRDDWYINLRGHRLEQFASRGQQRASLLALLLLSARILEESSGERPIVLFDDVLSELDGFHQKALLESLADHQVLITSTHPVPLKSETVEWLVENGKVTQPGPVRTAV